MIAAAQPQRIDARRPLASRRLGPARHDPRRRHPRRGKRLAGQKTAPGIFFAPAPKTRPETAPQVTETHLESATYVFVFVSGCTVAPNNAGTTGTGSSGSYGTLEVGINMSGTVAGVSGSQTTGLIVDTNGNVGVFQTHSVVGTGVGESGGVGLYVTASNAPDIENYKLFSVDASTTAGDGLGGSLDFSTWYNGGGANGTAPFVEGGFTVGGTGGASAQMTGSVTTVTPLFHVTLPYIPPDEAAAILDGAW